MASVLRWLWVNRNYFIIFITPLLILPLPLVFPTPEARCGFAIILMALYWCTECMPLAITALLPVILFPMMGIMESGKVCVEYLKDTNMLFIGGLLVAIAVEHWNLHKRIALSVLLIVGVRPALLMMGFMIVTAFLSMWISNTATTAMMLPISQAVLEQLSATEADSDEKELREGQDNRAFELTEVNIKHPLDNVTGDKPNNNPDLEARINALSERRRKEREVKYLRLFKGMSLSVCYSASIGGTATLTGTTPNLILKGQMDDIFPDNNDVINFASWFGFAFPNMVLMLALSWFWLQFMYLGFNLKNSFGCGLKNEGDKEAYRVMKNEYKKLGPISFAEGAVLVIFVILVILWFTREPGFMPGWATELFNKNGQYVTDGTVAIFMSTLFFIIPSRLDCSCSVSANDEHDEEAEGVGEEKQKKDKKNKLRGTPTLLNWKVIHEHMPWNIVLLLGGGFALARGSEHKKDLQSYKAQSPIQKEIFYLTEITLQKAFSYGNLKVLDMAKVGFILNIIGILSINLGINTWGMAMFNLGTFPAWANTTNATSTP
uniref:Solute carrier family 13 member 2-like n=1 Tax=Sinocyclocheilus rhinocerous TaxID=307959 RepID=A0A673IXS2_9TELE